MIVRKAGAVTIVGMTERVDSVTARVAEQELGAVIHGDDMALLLDFSATKYIASAGLRVVLQAAKAMKAKGGRFALCSLQELVHEIFETAGLVRIVDLYESESAALVGMALAEGGGR